MIILSQISCNQLFHNIVRHSYIQPLFDRPFCLASLSIDKFGLILVLPPNSTIPNEYLSYFAAQKKTSYTNLKRLLTSRELKVTTHWTNTADLKQVKLTLFFSSKTKTKKNI